MIKKTNSYTKIYKNIPERNAIWKEICKYIQKEIPVESTVLDLGCGYCNFINNISAKKKYALDIDVSFEKFADKRVNFIHSSSVDLSELKNSSIDIVFSSNLLEHLIFSDIEKTIEEVFRVLKDQGKLIIIQPNFYFCYREYFHDYTHKTIFTHIGLSDYLTTKGFNILKLKPKFLPLSIKKDYSSVKLPDFFINKYFVKLYMKLPFKPFGKQMYLVAEKT